MAKYEKYAEYKDSGVKWFGSIPEHWSSFLFKRVVANIKDGTHGTHARVENGELLLSAKNVFNNGIEIGENESYIPFKDYEEITSNGFPKKGDILVTCVGTIGRSFVYPFDKSLAFQRSVSFMRLNKKGNPQFYKYFIESKAYQSQLESLIKSSAQGGIYMGDLINTVVIKCPLDEQIQISNFLDHETAKIDSLIAKQEKLIELLKEKRQAVISHAVTKGLNPDVTMKDSGVEWLGQVPEHWIIKANKFLLDFITSGSRGWAQYYADSGALFFRIANLTRDTIEPKLESLQYVEPPKGSEGERSKIKLDDLLISITADLGSICVADSTIENGYVSQHVSLCRPKNMYKSRWLAYSILSNSSKEQLLGFGYGGTKIQLSLEDIKEVVIAVPPQQEQVEIVKYIDGKLSQLECLIKNANRLVSTLSERRIALISAAVTGKIDVRNWQAPDEAVTAHTV